MSPASLYIHGLSHHGGHSLAPPRSTSQSRVLSARTPSPDKSITKAKSSSALGSMAAVAAAPRLPSRMNSAPDVPLSTLPDPRSPPSNNQWRNGASTPHHPDLSSEVAALSDKLINAINHQTHLDDTLAATRQELEEARDRIHQLESEAQLHREQMTSGILVKKSDVENELSRARAQIAEEKASRSKAEKDKREMEKELETLTASLFEEANNMVAAAKKDTEAVERKNEQLKAQLKDTEMLLASHQEQLTELKVVMQQMSLDQAESESQRNGGGSTAPSSPNAQQTHDNMSRLFEALNLTGNTPGSASDLTPGPATSFTHLMKPVCRTDSTAYEDFRSLLQSAQKSGPPSRVTSGTYGGLNVMGLGKLGDHSPFSHAHANGSNASLATSHSNSPATPHHPVSNSGTSSPREPFTPLKETKFYKRMVTEDIEPTLRLDLAPGVSWLTRRTILTSICEGSLIVEPMPASTRIYVFSCAMCGENRKGDRYLRTHRFRTSDSDNAQRYPLCKSCLEKVRTTCDFVGFLRMIKDGHIRCHDLEEEKDAWEECVKLREKLFWCKLGGGVIPAFVPLDSPRPDQDQANRHTTELTEGSKLSGARSSKTERGEDEKAVNGHPAISESEHASAHETKASVNGNAAEQNATTASNESSTNGHDNPPEPVPIESEKQSNPGTRDSLNVTSSSTSPHGSRPQTPSRNGERLSLTIPGSFT